MTEVDLEKELEAILKDKPGEVSMNGNDCFEWKGENFPSVLRNHPMVSFVAAFFGAREVLRKFVSVGINPCLVDDLGCTVAHFACAGGDVDCCTVLLDAGVSFWTL